MRRTGQANLGRGLARWLALGLACLGCAAHVPAPESATGPAAQGALLPVQIRRLSNVEYERTLAALLQMPVEVADRLPPDVRQSGYTRNAEQVVSPAVALRVAGFVEGLAERAVTAKLAHFAPCHPRGGARCRDGFLVRMAERAWRRPASSVELQSLRVVFDAGAADTGGFGGGARSVLALLMQSPSLWYLSERGAKPLASGVVALDSYETASSLAYWLTGGPPDETLLEAARRGELKTATQREQQARRLLGQSETRHHFRQFVMEWLEVDQLVKTAKDDELFPGYEQRKQDMLKETGNFVDEVLVHRGASLEALLNAGFVSVTPAMARFYGLSAYGPRVRSEASGRLGLLQQASFLAAHAHPDSTSPVKRGDFILRKVLCVQMPRPAELDIEVVIPPLDASHTTRERFRQHAEDPECGACHRSIDALGYTFENFDAQGAWRQTDHGKAVESAVEFALGGERRALADSLELSRWLGGDARSRECFARQAFRYFSAQSEPAPEQAFVELTERLPPPLRGNLIETLVAFVKSDAFVRRRAVTVSALEDGAPRVAGNGADAHRVLMPRIEAAGAAARQVAR